MMVVALALILWLLAERLAGTLQPPAASSGQRMRADGWLRGSAAALMALSVGVVCAGIGLLALWSFSGPWRFPDVLPRSLTLTTWMRTLANLAMPLRDTLALAAVSSLAATVLALGSLECATRHGATTTGRALQSLYVPLIVPQIAFLFGLQSCSRIPSSTGRFPALPIVHLTFVFPYVLLSLAEPWRAFDPRYAHLVRALGRGPDAVFWRCGCRCCSGRC